MARNGYIKLHRKITEWGWYHDANTFRVFIHLLIMASYDEHGFRGHELKPGQVVCGRKQLAKDLRLSEQEIRTSLNHLKSTNEITIKTTNKFSIITIENWGKFQGQELEDNQQINQQANQQSTNKQPHRRNKEYKNIRGRAPNKASELENFYAMTEEWANDEK